jgi:hypothetical protein
MTRIRFVGQEKRGKWSAAEIETLKRKLAKHRNPAWIAHDMNRSLESVYAMTRFLGRAKPQPNKTIFQNGHGWVQSRVPGPMRGVVIG